MQVSVCCVVTRLAGEAHVALLIPCVCAAAHELVAHSPEQALPVAVVWLRR
jgi:hypothetical protein